MNANERKSSRGLMRFVTAGFPSFCASLFFLQLESPWLTYYGDFDFSLAETLASYVAVATGFGIVVALSSSIARRVIARSAVGSAAVCVVLVLGITMVFTILLLGSMTRDGIGHGMGAFVAGWKFVNFFFYVGVPVASVAGVLQVMGPRWGRR